jgi:hypothetical protein
MREIYFVACGIILGVTFRDWLKAYEERIAWRASDIAADNLEHRARCARREAELNPQPAPEPVPAATPA